MSDVLIILGPASQPVKKTDLAAFGFASAAVERTGGAFDALFLGPASPAAARELSRLGARKLFVFDHPDLASYTAEAYAAAVAGFLAGRSYRLIAAATTSSTREYFPRLAARLSAPMASDVLALDRLDAAKAAFTRAVFVGNLLASVELEGPLALATCRASEFDAPPEQSAESPIEALRADKRFAHARKRSVSLSQARSERPELIEAEVVVTAGRGTRGPNEGIPLAARLADVLGGALGATRAVVDAGWLPNEYQVGQTGKIVAPKLYIALGVSGAIQHLAGMRNSKHIVAINKDPDAPIFEVADVGLVADLFQVVPEFIEALQTLEEAR
jgi:electron transfer flavoprotein alpha subunit